MMTGTGDVRLNVAFGVLVVCVLILLGLAVYTGLEFLSLASGWPQ